MSLSQSVTKAVNEIVYSFIQQISEKYNLDGAELLKEWDSEMVMQKPARKTATKSSTSSVVDLPSATDELNSDDLLKYKKPELQALCRQRGVKCSGTKTELISYLLGKPASGEDGEENEKPVKTSRSKAKKSDDKSLFVSSNVPVAKQIKKPSLALRANQFGNFEHPETSLVFNKVNSKVIGRQNPNGTIEELTNEDINTCKRYKFDFVLPTNLDQKTKLEDERVEELEEDDEPIEDDEEIIEENEPDVIVEVDDADDEDIVEEELIEDEDDMEEEEEIEETAEDYE